MKVRKTTTKAMLAGAFGAAAVGFGAGIAHADPPFPAPPPVPTPGISVDGPHVNGPGVDLAGPGVNIDGPGTPRLPTGLDAAPGTRRRCAGVGAAATAAAVVGAVRARPVEC